MRAYELRDILAGTGGEYSAPLPVQPLFLTLERDSRNVKPGDVFIAVTGEQFDGHMFVGNAVEHGATTAIVSREWAAQNPDVGIPMIMVDDPVKALQRWAAWRRDRLHCRVVGITGSIGKTSAKESIAAVLGQRWKVFKSPGNFNNEIGLPLTLLDAPDDVEVLVLEMGGAYAFGELEMLAGIAKPDVAVVTNIYPVHLERMGTIENIAKTKQELVEAIPESGLIVLNGDDVRVRNMIAAAKGRVITYGVEDEAEVRASDVSTDGLAGTTFRVEIDGKAWMAKVPFIGAPGVQIALVALAVGYGFGMDVAEMLVGLQDPEVQVRLVFVPGPNGSQLIDDTYNASTPSVLAALGLLRQIPAKRRIAVLGEMREMGSIAENEHRVIGGRAGDIVDMLVGYGDLSQIMIEEAQGSDRPEGRPLETHFFEVDQRDDLVEFLKTHLLEGDVVLLKGAHGLWMNTIVDEIRPESSGDVNGATA
ncbi:MAG TPA: UDP-N-acetylmuramoyl-tripeptide--D-alanyl-D-alanine ligase [Thermomicrobiales bacterium]|nr:UDP-N-acetylmuramoyl-tripeptide--D-alanyl-D-alanine ligase [Thermomicrobiales bacterium]